MTQATPPIPVWKDDAEKQAELRSMKFRATALLVGVTLVFIATKLMDSTLFWVGLVQATAEASMVGAIADWFAVTALFRHPLGIKIPHTAVIPLRKDSFGERLGQFIQQNFLTGDIIVERIRALNISRRAAQWISHPENSENIADLASAGFSGMVQVVKDEDVQDLIERGIVSRVRSTRITPVIGHILNLVTSGPKRQELLYNLMRLLTHLIEENKTAIRRKIIEETPWWLPWSIDVKVYQRIVNNLAQLLEGMEARPDHPIHEKFDALLARFVDDLQHSPEVIAKGEALKEELLDHPVVREFSSVLWQDIKASLLARGERPDNRLREPVRQGIAQIGQALMRDEVLLAKIDRWIEDVVCYLMREYGHVIGHLISQTVRQWDADATSQKIELTVGKDLQYIRINGTIVGGMVGLIIHLLSLLL